MLNALRRLLNFKFSVAELIGIALILGAPYLIMGVIWSTGHSSHLEQMHGLDLEFSYIGSIVFWPALLFSDVCLV